MKCSRCQHENPSTLKFCGECGAHLAAVCAFCGAANSPEQKFCGECGTKLSPETARATLPSPDSYTPKHLAERILTSRSALEGERKQVTVLFADLKGSMELLADRDPEEARQLLDPVLEHMIESVHLYEGTVNRVMGDGIMALFGAPLALEDHAVRACYAALRMQSAIRSYSEQLRRSQGVTVRIRVGLNSGEVVVCTIGSDLHMEYTAVGQTAHLAARMEQLADPGSTLLTQGTLQLVEGFVAVRPQGPVPVKGVVEPVEVFELTGAGAARARLQASALRGLTKFVGRNSELAQIDTALERAQSGRGEVLALVGEAGVGKSRLVWEVIHSHRVRDWLVVQSTSMSHGNTKPYGPAIDLLKDYFHIDERDDGRRIREKVVGKLLMLDRKLEPLLPALLFVLGTPIEDGQWQRLDPPQRRLRILEACKQLLIREAQVQPLLVVFEDLHWIDNETQAFLDHLVETLPASRVLLLATYRAEYQHGWGTKTYYTQTRIDPLPAESAQALLALLLGNDASLEPLKKVLIERTEGNPLFLEESVRALIETGTLRGTRGAYRLRGAGLTVELPATIQAMLATRIDRLAPEAKRLLQAAAVVGKDVPYALLESIADLDTKQLRQRLSELQAAEFLYETRLFPHLEYTFKHALTHEAAYVGVLRERRRSLHARILKAIERIHADRLAEHVERLGHHAFHAEVWDEAWTYLRQAGDKAFARSANREAAATYEHALGALTHLPETRDRLQQAFDLRLRLVNLYDALAEPRRSLDHALEAQPLAERLHDPLQRGWGLSFMCYAYGLLGDTAAAAEQGEAALALIADLGSALASSHASHMLAIAYRMRGSYRKAAQLLLRFPEVPIDSLLDGPPYARQHYVWSRGLAAASLAELGAFDAAVACSEEAERALAMFERPWERGATDLFLGIVYLCKGDLERAVPRLERCLQIARSTEVPMLLINVAPQLGRAYNLLGRFLDSIALLEPVGDFAEGRSDIAAAPRILAHLGEAYGLAGRTEEGRAVLQRALDVARQRGMRGHEAWALYLAGDSYALCDPADAFSGHQYYSDAVALAHELEMRPLEAQCHLAIGELAQRSGLPSEACDQLTKAAELFREMGMQFWPEKAESAFKAL